MNINHITFSPEVSTLCLYFHGCNFKCKACIRKKTLKDVHLHKISSEIRNNNINLEEVINKIRTLSKIAEFIAGVDENIPYRIDGYVKVADLYRKPSPKEVEKAAAIARNYLRNVTCLRGDEKLCSQVVEIL